MEHFTQSQGENINNDVQTPDEQPSVPKKRKSLYGTLSVFVGLVCVVLAIVGLVRSLSIPFYKIPVIEMFMDEQDKELFENYESQLEEIEAEIKNEFDKLDEEEKEELQERYAQITEISGVSPEKAVELIKNPSINEIISFANELVASGDNDDGNQELLDMFNVIRYMIIGISVVVVLFATLAALCKSRVLSILGCIPAGIFFYYLSGITLVIIYLVAVVIHVILVSMHKKAIAKY